MLIDSHAHLPANKIETKKILQDAGAAGVVKVINIGTSIENSQKALTIAQEFENVYASVGIYPHEHLDTPITTLKSQLEGLLEIPKAATTATNKLVAIGECGIDITNWQNQRPVAEQIELFEMQVELAVKHNLPLIIHNRNGDEHIITTLKKYDNSNLVGVAHCFDGTRELAKNYLDLNFYISFSGFITYNSKKYLHETVENTPLDKILIETDAPYILPKGLKQDENQQNEPKNAIIIAQKVAEIKNLPSERIYEETYANTCKLFKI
jgi:TatD DNase family protein